MLTVVASPRWLERAEREDNLPRQPVPLGRDDGAARRLLRELRGAMPCSLLAIEGLALELLAAASRAPHREPGNPAWLSRAVEFLHTEFHRTLTLADIAQLSGTSASRLSSTFKRQFGRSVGDYQPDLRVSFVRDRLHSDEPLVEIALAAGFADQAHCTRVFKRLTGQTPGVYRAQARTQARGGRLQGLPRARAAQSRP